MNWLLNLMVKKQEEVAKTADASQREALVDAGKEQFKKLVEMGLRIHEVPLQ